MANDTFQKYQLLNDYLKNVYQVFPKDHLDELLDDDPAYYSHILQAEQQLARLKAQLFNQHDVLTLATKVDLRNAQQMTMDSVLFPASAPVPQPQKAAPAPVATPAPQPQKPTPVASNPALTPALPTPPAQTTQQALKATTMWTPLPSIVSPGYDRQHTGVNWPHYENMLKLYTLNLLTRGRTLTTQQETDKTELEQAIVAAEEARLARALARKVARGKGPKKPKAPETPTLHDVLQRFENNRYLEAGHNVIHAQVLKMDTMDQVDFRIQHTINDNNSEQLDKVKQKALGIVRMMRVRYTKDAK